MALLLGIDLGTSGVKACVFDEHGAAVAETSAAYPTVRPQPGWAEHDPNDWWVCACRCVRVLTEKIAPRRVDAVGVDGISGSIVSVDRTGEPTGTAPIWMDTRSGVQCDELRAAYGAENLLTLSGNPVGAAFSLPKLLWMRREQPERYARTAAVLECNSYLVYKLTGAMTMEPSQGFNWSCFDMRRKAWDAALCRDLGVEPLLPRVAASDEVVGAVTAEAARETGLAAGTPVVAGGMDTACGCLAAGLVRFGQTQEQGGQSGGAAVYTDAYRPDARLMYVRHVCPEGYLVCGATVGGSASYAWFQREFGQGESFRQLDALAASVPPGSGGLVFLPYMNGERTPLWDADAKGCYFGLDFTKTRAHMARATLEGVAYSLRHVLEAVRDTGSVPTELLSVGGATKSPLWMQIKADVTGRRMVAKNGDAGSALGAAMTAGVGVGVYADFAAASARVDRPGKVYEPDPANAERYGRLYEVYKALYERTKDCMKALGETDIDSGITGGERA